MVTAPHSGLAAVAKSPEPAAQPAAVASAAYLHINLSLASVTVCRQTLPERGEPNELESELLKRDCKGEYFLEGLLWGILGVLNIQSPLSR